MLGLRNALFIGICCFHSHLNRERRAWRLRIYCPARDGVNLSSIRRSHHAEWCILPLRSQYYLNYICETFVVSMALYVTHV